MVFVDGMIGDKEVIFIGASVKWEVLSLFADAFLID